MASVGELFKRAVQQHKTGNFSEAEELYRRIVRVDPHHADALHLLGVAAHQQQRHASAVDFIIRAIAVNNHSPLYYSNLGAAYRAAGQSDQAAEQYRQALKIEPTHAEAHYNLGNVLLEQGNISEAAGSFTRAVELKPDFADAHHNWGTTQRMLGNFCEGWDEYEYRFQCDIPQRDLPWPIWDGAPLRGKTLLVHAEQGIGDEIMFASCLPDLAAVAGQVFFECDPRLVPLFARSFPQITPLARRDDFRLATEDFPVPIDAQISAGSLPRFFRRDASAFPCREKYFQVDDALFEKWTDRFSTFGTDLKVGISWRGGKTADVRRKRTTELAQWQPILALPGLQFVALQYDDCQAELKLARQTFGVGVHDWPDIDRRNDLNGLAAQIAALDLVISVDNATVHLSGALGVPTWVLLPHVADWRWMHHGDESLWYRSVRLFRQETPGEWNGPIQRISAAVRNSFLHPDSATISS